MSRSIRRSARTWTFVLDDEFEELGLAEVVSLGLLQANVPEPKWFLGLTFYQWAALALAAGPLWQWRRDRRSQLAPKDRERA